MRNEGKNRSSWAKQEDVSQDLGVMALIASYPDRKDEIYLSQGHPSLTAVQHYVNLPFIDEDKFKMKEWVEGQIRYC